MYFKSRVEAGKLLAEQLAKKYTGDNTTVVALSDGGAMVGAQIALKLHCALTMLLTDAIKLPREDTAIGGITQDGTFTYNTAYSPGQIEELVQEYRGLIEQEKMDKMSEMHRLMGRGGLIKKSMLRGHNVILVSDGLSNGFSLDLASEFLKPINIKRLIVATPLASVPAVDRMHILADEICCLSVIEEYMFTDHYYDTQDVPDHEQVVKTIEEIVSHWR
jgi:putative phosphoribosyl transferase